MEYDGQTVKAWAGNSQWRAWRADLARFRKHGYSGWGSEGFWCLTAYRMQKALSKSRYRSNLLLPVWLIVALIKKLLTMVTHINLPVDSEIGPGLLIPHVGPIQVTPGSVIGADCAIHHVVTLAAAGGAPRLGDHVMVGCHVCIVGPIEIGDRVIIGAGAVVAKTVASDETVVGQPFRILELRNT